MVRSSAVVSVTLFLLYCPVANSKTGEGRNPQEKAQTLVMSLAKEANSVEVFHTPAALMGRVGLTKQTVSINWLTRSSVRCITSCDLKLRRLFAVLGSAEAMSESVSNDISTVIVFRSDDRVVGRIYGHLSGRFILIGIKRFRMKESLASFFETRTAFEW